MCFALRCLQPVGMVHFMDFPEGHESFQGAARGKGLARGGMQET